MNREVVLVFLKSKVLLFHKLNRCSILIKNINALRQMSEVNSLIGIHHLAHSSHSRNVINRHLSPLTYRDIVFRRIRVNRCSNIRFFLTEGCSIYNLYIICVWNNIRRATSANVKNRILFDRECRSKFCNIKAMTIIITVFDLLLIG